MAGGLFFARKANKLPWFVTAAKDAGIGIDTASLAELQETLQLGVNPEQITVTAVGKERELIEYAVISGCMIVIDNADELEIIKAVCQSSGKTARIGLRFSGFTVNGHTVYSRFGFPLSDWHDLNVQIMQSPSLKLELLHAHLDKYDVDERAAAARQLLELADSAVASGHKVSSVDLGGGILMRYLNSSSEWNELLNSLVASVLGDIPCFTHQADGFGYTKVGTHVIGTAHLYPAWNNISKERFIAAVLDTAPGGTPLHKEIFSRGLKLFFEPGRVLLDNTGMTFANVTFRKRDTSGALLIGTAMNRMNLRPFRAEFCSDPIFLSDGKREAVDEGAFLVGNLCSESDFLLRRKLRLKHMPLPGDIISFANTAGYLAHHMEIGTHGSPLPKNVLIDADTFEICSAV